MPTIHKQALKHCSSTLWRLSLIMCLSVLLKPGSLASTPTTRMLILTNKQAISFQGALNAISGEGKVAIIAEGAPLYPLLSSQKAEDLTAPRSLSQEVKAVADAYDYQSERIGTVFMLKKRYTDSADLPAVTSGECRYCLELIKRVSDPFNPNVGPPQIIGSLGAPGMAVKLTSPLTDPLVKLLSSAQLMEMKNSGLPVSSLTVTGKYLVRRILFNIYVQEPLIDQLPALPLLAQIPEAIFKEQSFAGSKNVFGFTLLFKRGVYNRISFHPLSQYNGDDTLLGVGVNVGPMLPLGPDPTDPVPGVELPLHIKALTDAVAALRSSHVTINPAVSGLPVTYAGLKYAPAFQDMLAISVIYGLHLQKLAPHKYLLSTPSVPVPTNVMGLPAALRQCIPVPLRRYLRLTSIVDRINESIAISNLINNGKTESQFDTDKPETPAELKTAMLERKDLLPSGNMYKRTAFYQTNKVNLALTQVQIDCVQRLRTLIQPMIQSHPSGVPLSQMGEQEHEALSTWILAQALQSIVQPLTEPMPPLLDNLNDGVLTGGISGSAGQKMFSVYINRKLPNGKVMGVAGIGGASYNG